MFGENLTCYSKWWWWLPVPPTRVWRNWNYIWQYLHPHSSVFQYASPCYRRAIPVPPRPPPSRPSSLCLSRSRSPTLTSVLSSGSLRLSSDSQITCKHWNLPFLSALPLIVLNVSFLFSSCFSLHVSNLTFVSSCFLFLFSWRLLSLTPLFPNILFHLLTSLLVPHLPACVHCAASFVFSVCSQFELCVLSLFDFLLFAFSHCLFLFHLAHPNFVSCFIYLSCVFYRLVLKPVVLWSSNKETSPGSSFSKIW